MAKLALILLITLQVILPCVFTFSPPFLPYPQASAAGGGGVFGNQHDKGQSSSEVHDDKQFSLNFDKKQGSSNQQSHDRGQNFGAAGGGVATAPVYPGWGGGWAPQPGWAPHVPQGWTPPQHGWGLPIRGGWGSFPPQG